MKTRFVLLLAGNLFLAANSQTITVPGSTFGTLVPLSVEYSEASGAGGSWIGLYREGATDGDYLTYQYINELVQGSLVFPGREETGLFNFRLFRGGGYDKIGTSSTFMIRQGMLPDATFHNGGIYRKETAAGFPDVWASAVRVMPDDRIVVAGNIRTGLTNPGGWANNGFIVARFLANGNLDPDFGQDGFASCLFPDLYNNTYFISAREVAAVAVQEDGKVVVGGTAIIYGTGSYHQVVILVRLTAGGTLDDTFGDRGIVVDNYKFPAEGPSYAWDELRCVEIDHQGRIWCGGGSLLDRPYSPGRPFIGRYMPDGTPDTGFGGIGMIAPVDSIFFRGYVESLVVPGPGSDGSLLAGATQVSQFGQNFFLLYKVDSNGEFVQDFGHNGIQVEHRPGWNNEQNLKSIGIAPNGSLIMMGGNSNWSMWLAAKSPTDGSEISSFGISGIVSYDPTYSMDVPAGMVFTPDNRILVGTSTMSYRWSVTRFGTDGNLSSDFGTSFYPVMENGYTVESFVAGIAMQSDGKIILVGGSRFSADNTWDFMMLRFVNNPASYTGIDDPGSLTGQLLPNYPNPFRDATTITWTQVSDSHVSLVLYDILGNPVAAPVNDIRPAGRHQVNLTPGLNGSRTLAPGTYFYRITIQPLGSSRNAYTGSKRMIILPDSR